MSSLTGLSRLGEARDRGADDDTVVIPAIGEKETPASSAAAKGAAQDVAEPARRGKSVTEVAAMAKKAPSSRSPKKAQPASKGASPDRGPRGARWLAHKRAGIIAEVMVTVGALLASFVFWELAWSNVQSGRAQSAVDEDLRAMWSVEGRESGRQSEALVDEPFNAFAYLHIPALGSGSWSRAMLDDVTQDALAVGPGHYPSSQAAGEAGNFAIAGHRDGQGAPFHNLNEVSTCDLMVVETEMAWHIYRVLPTDAADEQQWTAAVEDCFGQRSGSLLGSEGYRGLPGLHVTTPDDVSVVAPVPGDVASTAEGAGAAVMTLTTCHPMYSNAERLIAHAGLERSIDKSARPTGWIPDDLRKAR